MRFATTHTTNSLTAFSAYRFHFNGKETDNEVYVQGNVYDYGFRIYNPRLGRWMSVDPLQQKYPSLSPYNFVANSPLMFVDPDGKRIKPTNQAAKDALNTLLKANPKIEYEVSEDGVYSLKGNTIDYENLKGDAATLVKVLSSVEIVEVTVTTTSQTNNDQTLQSNTDKKATTVGESGSNTTNPELKDAETVLDTEGGKMTKTAEDVIYKGAEYVPDKNKPEDVINVTPTKSGNDWIYFDNKNKNVKAPQLGGTDEQNTMGRVLINGTGQSSVQNGKTLLKTLSEVTTKP
jgi:RHS repeat-associated protein